MNAEKRLDRHQIAARNAAALCGAQRLAECVQALLNHGLCIRLIRFDAEADRDPLILLESPPPNRNVLRGETVSLGEDERGRYRQYAARLRTCDVIWRAPI